MYSRWMSGLRGRALACIVSALAIMAIACNCTSAGAPGQPTAPGAEVATAGPGRAGTGPTGPHAIPGLPLVEGYTVGMARVFGNLAVFPIYASVQENLGDFTTLEAALERGTAVVRELGAEAAPGSEDNRNNVQQMAPGDGAQVNRLVIENKGDLSILVLAGTIVKGGKQDRQIGQDFLVGARQTVPVDAFCVEHGRWNANREGAATGGKFSTMKVLANAKVRAAGQYEQNQSEVWNKVGEVNKSHKKETASDTLVASVEDTDVVAQREALGRDVAAFLAGAESTEDIVGMAYAVDSKVRGVRWFMNRKLFLQYQDTLVGTAALEAITAQADTKAEGKPPTPGATEAAAVVRFVNEVQTGREERRATSAENENAYKYSDDGYGSSTIMKAAPPAATAAPGAAPPAKPKAITHDYVAK